MSCTVCGSNANCGCSTNLPCQACNTSNCGGNCTNYSGLCSGNTVPSSPQPYYACAPACKEDNKQKIYITQYSTTVKVVSSWNVPACGEEATVSIPGLTSVVIGSYLWNEQFGYFEVTAFDSGLQQVTILNNCNDGNATPGTNVPACTLFVNTSPPANTADSNTPCVEIDFTAPAVGDCIDITLSTTTGITAGDTVQIGTGFYRVSTIKPNNIITICNDGEGITPGTPVIAKDANDNYQYCLQVISNSPCDREPILDGAIVSCSEGGILGTLIVPEEGWVLAGNPDAGENHVQAIPIGLDPACSTLSAALAIVNGTANYVLTVESSSDFVVTDVLQIAGFPNDTGTPAHRFTVTGVPSATSVNVTCSPTPSASVNIPTGTLVCRIGCCELLSNEIDDILCTPQVFTTQINQMQYVVPIVLNVQGEMFSVVDSTVVSVNLNTLLGANYCPNSAYMVEFKGSIASNSDFFWTPGILGDEAGIYQEIEIKWNVGYPLADRVTGKIVYNDYAPLNVSNLFVFTDTNSTYYQLRPTPVVNNFNYHQNDVNAVAYLGVGVVATTLELFYRTVISEIFISLGTYDTTELMVSGFINIYKVDF
jgi:hypothetical protein